MTEKEAIKALEVYILQLQHSLAEEECEEYNEKEMAEAKRKDEQTLGALNMAIKALEEIQQYRAIGTVEELKKVDTVIIKRNKTISRMLDECMEYEKIGTVEECQEAKRFKEYFDELYGTGLEIANWHENGSTEPFDNFYGAAIDWSGEDEIPGRNVP